VVTIYQEG